MVLTRAAANNRAVTASTAPVKADKPSKAAARAAKKLADKERARMAVIQKVCADAQRQREEAAASAYIGSMKYLGAIDNPS
jgi:hypothetical protein